MKSNFELDAEALALKYSPSEDSFLQEAKQRFPRIRWERGMPQSRDKYGNAYIAIVVGGCKKEGEEYPVICNTMNDEVWEFWWDSLRKLVTSDVYEIQIRSIPVVDAKVEQVFDDYFTYPHSFISRARYQIFGRFSFIRKENKEEANNG